MARLLPIDPAERDEFVLSCKSMQVATVNEDGSPHLTTLWFGRLDDQIVFWTQRTSLTARNLRRDPRLACLWESGTEYSELKGVSVNGHAELLESDEDLLAIGEAVICRNYEPAVRPDYRAMALAGTRVGVRVVTDKLASWDFARSGRSRPPVAS